MFCILDNIIRLFRIKYTYYPMVSFSHYPLIRLFRIKYTYYPMVSISHYSHTFIISSIIILNEMNYLSSSFSS